MAEKQKGGPQKVRIPLIGAYSNRGSDPAKDQRFVNAFPETRKVEQLDNTRIYINKRPGLVELKDIAASAEGRGLVHFYIYFYAVIGNTVYRVSNTGATVTSIITLPTSTGPCGIVECNSSTLGDYIFICDGTVGWVVKSDGTATQVTDVDFPTPHIPSPTFIDGYVILAKGSDVYNCDVDDPLSWQTDQYLSAEMFPDPVRALARQNNQVVVFGDNSIEFFYDAANAAGSPLSRNDAAAIQMGIAAPQIVYQNEQFCVFVAQSNSGGRAVWRIDGFKAAKISDEYVERILDAETSITSCHGYGFRTKGHMFFLINLVSQNRTLVYDMDEKLWHEWASGLHNGVVTDPPTQNIFDYNHVADNKTGKIYLLGASTGDLYYLDPSTYTDETTPIVVEIRTNKYDMDSYKRKFANAFFVVGDRYEDPNYVDVSWSDDDYETWSSTHRIYLNDDYPSHPQLGAFRRRAWRIKHDANYPLRLESLEVTYTEGIS